MKKSKFPCKTIEKLINAAKQQFAKKGFAYTSVSDITRQAGVGKGTYYIYFKTKEDVVAHMINELRTTTIKMINDFIITAEDTVKEQYGNLLYQLMLNTFNNYYSYKDIVVILAYSDYSLSKKLIILKEQNIRDFRDLIEKILDLGVKKQFLRPIEIKETAELIFILVEFYSIEVIFKHKKEEIQHHAKLLYETVFNGIKKV